MPFLTATTSKTISSFTKPGIPPFNFRPENAIRLTVQTDSLNNVTIYAKPVAGRTMIIDWGDGTAITRTSHTTDGYTRGYASPGTYNVKIYGDVQIFGKSTSGSNNPYYQAISSFGNITTLTSLAYAFARTGNITTVPSSIPSTVTSLQGMFYNDGTFNDGNVSYWDTSNVTDMSGLFSGASAFNQDLTGWCTTTITSEPGSFADLSGLSAGNKPIWGTCPLPNDKRVNGVGIAVQTITNERSVLFFAQADSTSSNVRVDWGDGNSYVGTGSIFHYPEHTYAANGTYAVKLFGNIKAFNLGGSANTLQRRPVKGCTTFGNISTLTQLNGAFFACANLTVAPSTLPGTVTRTDQMFINCSSINDSNIALWNTANVTLMNSMFERATVFNANIANWNTANVTSMDNMFYLAEAFFGPIDNWNTSKVTNMSYMFRSARAFNANIASWNTANVTTTRDMFSGANAFNQPIGNWDTSKVTDMREMFNGATAFNANIANWNTANVTTLWGTFFFAENFNQPIGNWNTANVTSLQNTFFGAYLFNQPIGNWDTAKVTTLQTTFAGGLLNFNQDLSGWNTSNVTNMLGTFSGCEQFNGNIIGWDTSKVTTMDSTFSGAYVFNANIAGWNTANVTTFNNIFDYALEFNQPIGNWNTSNVTNMQGAFASEASLANEGIASKFNQPLANWDTSNVTNMNRMFMEARAFNQNISGWCVTNITSLPTNFATSSALALANYPVWGTCPLYSFALSDPNAFDTSANDRFGVAVAIDGDRCIVGANLEDDALGNDSGKAYIFDVATGTLLHTLDNPNAYGTPNIDQFGYAVAIDGDRCIVGAPLEDDAGGTQSGKAYIFDVATGTLLHILDNPNVYSTSANDRFGYSVAISGNYVVVGAYLEDKFDDEGLVRLDSGKAYVYDITTLPTAPATVSSATLVLDNPNAFGIYGADYFGYAVAISGDRCIIGAYQEDDAGGNSSGKAYIFDVTTGALLHTLDNPNAYGTSAYDSFGWTVGISGNRAIVGVYNYDGTTFTEEGYAYIFDVSSGTLLHTLSNPNPYDTGEFDRFGFRVGISGNLAIVSAYVEDDAGGTDSGKAYIFDVATGALVQTLDNPNTFGTSDGDYFGSAVAISGNRAIVGAYLEDDADWTNSGKAYIFGV